MLGDGVKKGRGECFHLKTWWKESKQSRHQPSAENKRFALSWGEDVVLNPCPCSQSGLGSMQTSGLHFPISLNLIRKKIRAV